MKYLFKHVKPYALIVAISLVLLFSQAMCELYLPNLMSNIVNVGIQQGGVEEKSPKSISENGMKLITLFLSDEDKREFEGAYTHTDGVFSLKDDILKDDVAYTEVGDVYAVACSNFLGFVSSSASQQSGETMSESGGISEEEFEKLYEMLPLLEQLPVSQRVVTTTASPDANASYMGAQVGAVMTKLFYGELGMDTAKIQRDYIFKVGLEMVGIALLCMAFSIGVSFFSSRVGSGVAMSMRRSVFTKVEGFTNNEFDKFSTASLITRTTNDVQQVQMLTTMSMRIMCFAPIMGIGGVIMALKKSASLSWVIAVAVLVILGVILVLISIVMPKFNILQKLIDRLNLVSREHLSGMMVIRAFGNEEYEEKRFDKANTDLADTNRFVLRSMALLMPVMMLVMNGLTVVIVWLGAKAIEASTLQIGDMLAFMQYAMHIIMSFLFIAMMFIMVPRAMVSARRIAEVLDTDYSVKEPQNPKKLKNADKSGRLIEFKDVDFRYANASEDVLSDVSFTARPGETTAIIGSTGSGKSTVLNLIMRFYDVTKGSISIDGTDIRDITTEDLRGTIGFVPQKGVLFSGTIADNIRYGKEDANSDEIDEAIETAQASEFVDELDEKTEHEIAQGGGNVSGGQKQRLAIARALVKKAPVYIFDDSFSALDFKTDANLRRALEKTMKEATVIIVAQRVGTIMNAEQIIVLDNGRIVGKGTHRELLKSCETYREIAESQLSKEELA